MTGAVFERQARANIGFLLNGRNIEIEFVVDTGFVGSLTLPATVIMAMGLRFNQRITAKLADDTSIRVDVYKAAILWNGEEREVNVLAMGRRPLLGTDLLDGHDVDIQFADGGLVTIERL